MDTDLGRATSQKDKQLIKGGKSPRNGGGMTFIFRYELIDIQILLRL